jgi:hypothetical protein
MVRSLLREVALRIEQAAVGSGVRYLADGLKSSADGSLEEIDVRRESMVIDVVVKVSGLGGEAAIGPENRIDASEQDDQIARYQATLEGAYPNSSSVIAFLTPREQEPLTASADSVVPTVSLSYG